MESEQTFTGCDVYSSSLGCEVYSDRRVPGSRSRASELHGPGWLAERHRVHLGRGPVEPGHHFTGNVLRNETEAHHQISGMEGNQHQCFARGPLSQFQTLRAYSDSWGGLCLRPPNPPLPAGWLLTAAPPPTAAGTARHCTHCAWAQAWRGVRAGTTASS